MLKKVLFLANLPFVLLIIAVVFGYLRFVNKAVTLGETELVTVSKGETVYGLLNRLSEQTELVNSQWYKLVIKLNPELAAIKTGTYKVPQQLTPINLLNIFTSGNEHQFQIRLIEGETIWQIRTKLKNHPNLRSTNWDDLRLAFEHPEGAFFPDTYAFVNNSTDKEILTRAHQKLIRVLNHEWQNRMDNLPYESKYEALIMASIIEKETAIESERPLIASVFINRLRKKMRLQTDPTVIYGIGENFDGDIKKRDLKAPTPYNTYVIKGLPPTPIAMVGEAAIHAALNPDESDYLYFVAQADGSHYFSKTLQEHNRAVQQYLKAKRAG